MLKKSYLEKYNDENSDVVGSLTVNKKIFIRFLSFCICSILYLIIFALSKVNGSHDIQTQFVNSFVNSIMIFSFCLSLVFIIGYILYRFVPTFNKAIDYTSYKIKKMVFVALDWVVILPICATIACFSFAFVFTFAQVDGESMYPTVSNESTVFVSYLEPIEQFDIVVAYITEEDSCLESLPASQRALYPEYYIKRVIGMPGDSVTWLNGVLTINGKIIDEYYFDELTKVDLKEKWTTSTGFDGKFQYKENGEIKTTYIIPEGYYFVMGDHRDVSIDSRRIGLVHEKNIEGVVKFEFGDSGIVRF